MHDEIQIPANETPEELKVGEEERLDQLDGFGQMAFIAMRICFSTL